jgi:hypothetical protein
VAGTFLAAALPRRARAEVPAPRTAAPAHA